MKDPKTNLKGKPNDGVTTVKDPKTNLKANPNDGVTTVKDPNDDGLQEFDIDCGKTKSGDHVTWRPYIDLLKVIGKHKEKRMSFYFMLDTPEGALIEKQLRISHQEWANKFKILQGLPNKADAKTSMDVFRKMAGTN